MRRRLPDKARRDELFTMRMTSDERDRLDRIASYHGLCAAKLVRSWLAKEEKDLGLAASTESKGDASTFVLAQRAYARQQKREGLPVSAGDPAESIFDTDDGQSVFLLRTKTSVLAVFDVLKSGRLRLRIQQAPG